MSLSAPLTHLTTPVVSVCSDNYVLATRLKGYLGDHAGAVVLADEACRTFPDDMRLRCLRGEKRLIVRDLVGALADLELAAATAAERTDVAEPRRAEVERDVIDMLLGRRPEVGTNRDTGSAGSPHAFMWRHLGIARYVVGRYDDAAAAFAMARTIAPDPMIHDWEYLALRRAGRDVEAATLLTASATLATDDDVTDLLRGPGLDGARTGRVLAAAYRQRLRLYRGETTPEALLRADVTNPLATATLGHGVASWYTLHGYQSAAIRCLERVMSHGDPVSFAALAAEHDATRAGLHVTPWRPPDPTPTAGTI